MRKTLLAFAVFVCLAAANAHAQGSAPGKVQNFKEVVVNGVRVISGSGNPEGATTAVIGTVYLRSNGSIYTKTSGTGNTGWTLQASGAGSGTVTSIGLTLPSLFSVSGSPVTTSGTIGATLVSQTANRVFAGPASGSPATPGWRQVVFGDIGQNGCTTGQIPKWDGAAWSCSDDATGGAPATTQYVTLATDGTIPNERVLTAGTGVTVTDGGAGSTVTVAADGPNITGLNAGNVSSGTLPVARGGTNLTAAADDNVMIGNGTTWQTKALPSCSGATTDKLLYNASTNTFSCGTDGSGGVSSGATVYTSAFTSPPGSPASGDVWVPNNGVAFYRYSGSAWTGWGPVYPFTDPTQYSWSWVNQGGATVDASSGGIVINAPIDSGADQIRARVKTVPSTPYTITAAVVPNIVNNGFAMSGIMIRDSVSGKIELFGLQTHQLVVKTYSGPAAWTGTPFGINNTWWHPIMWLRIADDGTTNRTFSLSFDGKGWVQVYQEARTTYLTADQVGFLADSNSSSYNAATTLLSWLEQ